MNDIAWSIGNLMAIDCLLFICCVEWHSAAKAQTAGDMAGFIASWIIMLCLNFLIILLNIIGLNTNIGDFLSHMGK